MTSPLSLCAEVEGLSFRSVPAGVFWMGEVGENPDSVPVHPVALSSSFCLAVTEVTQDLYVDMMGKNPSHTAGERHPVEQVTWYDAIDFSNALSKDVGAIPCYQVEELPRQLGAEERIVKKVHWNQQCTGFRLPTEAEWEWAARGGRGGRVLQEPFNREELEKQVRAVPQQQRVYPGGAIYDQFSWHKLNSKGHQPVASAKVDSWGFYDLGGNVAEWVWDSYKPYEAGFQLDPVYSDNPHIRISRGGGWSDMPNQMRAGVRSADGPEWSFDWVGFRVVKHTPE